MPTEVEQLRDLARAFWASRPIPCPKHPGVNMIGEFVQTTFADHIFLTCPRGNVENMNRGDAIQCYRCQSPLEINTQENATTGVAHYTFTCVRCLSWGEWAGRPETAKIGKDAT